MLKDWLYLKMMCWEYMQTEEVNTICTVRKAIIVVHNSIKHDKSLHLSMDGTYLNQKS